MKQSIFRHKINMDPNPNKRNSEEFTTKTNRIGQEKLNPMENDQVKDKNEDDEDDHDDEEGCCEEMCDSQTRETTSSPLVLEPLGMSISFHNSIDEDGLSETEVITTSTSLTTGLNHHHHPLFDDDDEDEAQLEMHIVESQPTGVVSGTFATGTETKSKAVSFWMIWRGPLLVYTVCLVLPSLSAYLMHDDTKKRLQDWAHQSLDLWNTGLCCGETRRQYKDYIQGAWIQYLCNTEETDGATEHYFTISYWANRFNLCRELDNDDSETILYRSIVASDVVEWKRDLTIVMGLSSALAVLRLLVILIASNTGAWSNMSRNHASQTKYADAEASLPGSALFQSAWSGILAYLGWKWFHDADFWPDFVLGHGTISRCWDLVILPQQTDDRKYEQQNSVLKFYVLLQASYYIHSVTFRLVRWLVRRRRRTSLIISMVQTLLALGLLSLAYFFPSLRRLMSIGMFSLDVSSTMRHCWHICAPRCPDGNSFIRKFVAHTLYWVLVLPSFVATRFLVYPMIWHSASTAEDWRMRLDEALWKGAHDQFFRLCNVCIVLLLLISSFSLHTLIDMGPLMLPRNLASTLKPNTK